MAGLMETTTKQKIDDIYYLCGQNREVVGLARVLGDIGEHLRITKQDLVILVTDVGTFSKSIGNGRVELQKDKKGEFINWNLKDDNLKNQTEETIDFIWKIYGNKE